MNKDKTIVYMICNDKQIKMTRDVFDYLMTVKHYNKKLKDEIIKLQQENERLNNKIKEQNLLLIEFQDMEQKLDIYKSRCKKASVILNNIYLLDDVAITNNAVIEIDKAINILNGSDEK